MSDSITTLARWESSREYLESFNSHFFEDHPLHALRRIADGRYQFGFEIGGYGTVVGYCATHSHKTAAGAEECGQRFFSGLPARRRWRRR